MAADNMGIMEKAVIGGVIALVMIVVMSQAVQATTPVAGYCCPICPDECFYTYDELYQHFTTAHPSQPIDIIWE